MRLLLGAAVLLVLTGCDNGRYQIASMPSTEFVWRLDTKTGEIAKCLHFSSAAGAAICSAPTK